MADLGSYVWIHPTAPTRTNQYKTMLANDPGVPAGYILTSGSDYAADERQQSLVAGVNSGGFPSYTNDAGQVAAQPNWPNGILGNFSGNKTTV